MPDSVFNARTLSGLGEDLESAEAAVQFAVNYLARLSSRVNYIQWAITCGDLDDALRAAVGLRVTSVVVGAEALAALSTAVEAAARTGVATLASSAAAPLPKAAAHAALAISGHLSMAAPV
jgi:hypothetical protein